MTISLTFDYGDGSQKRFTFKRAGTLAQHMGMASAMAADLRFQIWPDRGEKDILAMSIDGHGHPAPGRWRITRDGTDFWPSVDEFEGTPLADGTEIVFTLVREG